MFNKRDGKMTGAWLLVDDSKQISDCTGGHKVIQFDTASRNKLKYIRKGGHYGQRNKQYIRVESLHGV